MAARNYVYSTMTAGVTYVTYVNSGNDLPEIAHKVHIAGGANVATKHLVTPRGVVTEVSDTDLEHLISNEIFQRHMKNGFIIVDTIKVDPEVKVADMEQADSSAPMVPEDFEKDNQATGAVRRGRKPRGA